MTCWENLDVGSYVYFDLLPVFHKVHAYEHYPGSYLVGT